VEIKPTGRKVKCSRCATLWEVYPEFVPEHENDIIELEVVGGGTPPPVAEPPPPPPPLESIPHDTAQFERELVQAEQSAVTVTAKRAKRKRAPWWIKTAATVAALQCVAMLWLSHVLTWNRMPVLESLYEMAGLHRTETVQLADVSVAVAEERKKQYLIVDGKLKNLTKAEIPAPVLQITLLNKLGKERLQKQFSKEGAVLEAGKTLPFHTKIPLHGMIPAHVRLDIGQGMELWLRK
jgi:hypothetical protein